VALALFDGVVVVVALWDMVAEALGVSEIVGEIEGVMDGVIRGRTKHSENSEEIPLFPPCGLVAMAVMFMSEYSDS